MTKQVIIILTEKQWHAPLVEYVKKNLPSVEWHWIDSKEDFNLENLLKINPNKIFIPHWSYIIPSKIFNEFECVVFHMTDLPYGRGGSPLQNLIVRGHKETKISALLVEEGLDTGDIYLKKTLSLQGSAQQIFERSTLIIQDMILEIVNKNLKPSPQNGEPTNFKRRTPEMSDLSSLQDISVVYDYIRMLDAQGYPHAFIETEYLRFEFNNANKLDDQSIEAHVRITKK